MGFTGIDVRQTGDRILVRALLLDASGSLITSGTATLRIYELQSDGSLKSFDFNDGAFKSGALTSETEELAHQTGNDGGTDTGIWTLAIEDVSGFVRGGVYILHVHHASAAPPYQAREFVYGDLLTQVHRLHAAELGSRDHDIITGVGRIYDEDGQQIATVTPAETIKVAAASWTDATLRLTAVGAFAGYIHQAGDVITITAGDGATTGQYEIASRVDGDTIELASSITGENGDATDVEGVIRTGRIMRHVA